MITAGKSGTYIDLLVQPNAHKPGVRGIHGDRLKVAVAEPAEKGKANRAVVAAVAELLGVRANAVSLVAGGTTNRKRVYVTGVDPIRTRELIVATNDE